jgi:mono/diheme cytochrome c family protein
MSSCFAIRRCIAFFALSLFGLNFSTSHAENPIVASAAVSYSQDVLPILRAHCQGCHQAAKAQGGVDLTSRTGLFGESESGSTVVAPGDVEASELLNQITPDVEGHALMPAEGPALKAEQIALIRQWIAEGAEVDAVGERPHYDAEHPPTYAKPATISALDVSPDGTLIAVSGVNETLLIDAAAAAAGERKVVRRLIGLASRIESIRFSPDGARLAVAGGLPGEQGELQVWNVASGELVLSHTAMADTLSGVCWSPDGKSIVFGGPDTSIHVVDAETGEQTMEQGAHNDWVLDVAFSNDGKYIVSGGRDQTLKLVETATGRFVDNITSISPGVAGGAIFSLARDAKRDLVAVGGEEGVPKTYMLHRQVERRIGDDSNLVRSYPAMPGRIFAVALSADGTRLAAASSEQGAGFVQVFAVPEQVAPPDDVKLIQGKVVDGRTADEKARVAEYNRAGAVRLAAAAGSLPPIYAMAFMPDGQTIVSGGSDGVLRLHRSGNGTLAAAVDVFEVQAVDDRGGEVVVAGDANVQAPPVEFLTDVMPVLGKLGCNAGTCHGARAGQNGFSLSLRGYDPLADYRALTDDLAGRRINRASPESSLMLLKATGAVPHGGHQVVEPGDRRYEILRRWIAEGAAYNAGAPRVVSIAVSPENPVLDAPDDTIAMKVVAKYSDGSEREVSADAFIESGDTEVATADKTGKLTAIRRGEAGVLARYEGAYAATTLTVMGDRSGFEWQPAPVYNRIDELVDVKLQRMRILPSELCDDEAFVRRVYLDLTGLPPKADDVRAFLADRTESRAKRAALVDRLIGSADYVEHWTNRWADLLMVNGKFLGSEGAAAYRAWIRQAVDENRPYDQFVRELFTSTGSNLTSPGGSYFKVLRTPDMIAETSSQVFMGVRFNCNKCHDHPFERWTQDAYYGWAAFFKDVRLQKDPAAGDRTIAGSAVEAAQPLFEIVDDGAHGEVLHLRTGKPAAPEFPFETKFDGEKPVTLRAELAAWLTSPDNRYFASSYVNRVWAHLTGAGLIEPIDDIRAGNPPTNPELLEWLTQEFVGTGFDVEHLIRTICNSRTYQLSHRTNRWNEDDLRNYSHALPRRLPAEALYDAVHRVVGSVTKIPGVPPGTRAAALPDSMIELESGLLSKLGRPARESGCECERSSELQLGPVMALLNGPTFADAIDDPESELANLEAATSDDGLLVDEVFMRVLGRAPKPEELAAGMQMLAAPVDDGQHLADAVAARRESLTGGFDEWRHANRPVDWQPLKTIDAKASMGSELAVEADGSIFASGAFGKGTYTITVEAPAGPIRSIRLEALADDRLPSKGPGRADNGNFVLSRIRVMSVGADPAEKPKNLKLRSAESDFNQGDVYVVSGAIDANPKTGWAVSPQFGTNHVAAFELARPVELPAGSRLVIELDQQYENAKHLLGKFRLSASGAEPPLLRAEPPAEWRGLLAAQVLGDADRTALLGYFLSLDAEYRELQRAERMLANPRLAAVQDLAWALINSPAFLFNH